MSAPKKVDPYNLDANFERVVVLLTCGLGGKGGAFYASVGKALDPEALSAEPHKMAVKAAHEVAKDAGGGGPRAPSIVAQRVRRWVHEGKATEEQAVAVVALFDAGEALFPPPDAQAVAAELAPLLRRRQEAEALKVGLDVYAKRGDMGKVVDLVRAAQDLGRPTDAGEGAGIDDAGFAAIKALGQSERLPTGVSELDFLLEGGPHRGTLSVVSFTTGGGKSQTLAHFAAEAVWRMRHVGVLSTEVPSPVWLARVLANLTGIPIDDIVEDRNDGVRLCRDILNSYGKLGPIFIQDCAPGVTTLDDVREFCDRRADVVGHPVEALFIDSADDLTVPGAASGKKAGHEVVKEVYRGLRYYVKDTLRGWGWTASQPKGSASTGGKKRKRIDTDDLADGMGKARSCDLLLTASVSEDQCGIDFFVPKRRLGRGRFSTGLLPADLSRSMVGPVSRAPRDKAAP